jgi:hypothetical protein
MTTFSISLPRPAIVAASPCFHPLQRDAGPLGDDVQNVLFAHDDAFFLAVECAIRPARTSNFSFACFSLSRICAAPSKSWFLDGAFLFAFDLSISASISFRPPAGGSSCRCGRANRLRPSTSMALSGKKRSVM